MLTTIYTIISAFGIILIYKFYISIKIGLRFYEKQGLPSYYFPLIGFFKPMLDDLKNTGDISYREKQRARTAPGRLLAGNLGSKVELLLNDPELIKSFFLNTENYIKDPEFMDLFHALMGRGLITSEGEQWKVQRKVLSNSFNFTHLKSILPNVQSLVHQRLLELGPKKGQASSQINVLDEMQKINGEIIGNIFFGEQMNNYNMAGKSPTLVLADILCEIGLLCQEPLKNLGGSWLIMLGIFPRHKKLMTDIKEFRKICGSIIEDRKQQRLAGKRAQSDAKDTLDQLLDYNNENNGSMSNDEIIDHFIALFLAGMDTTSHLVTMAVYYLDKHPEHKAMMISELKQYYQLEKSIDIDELNKLEFTTAFSRECLRTSTPTSVMFPRVAVRDHKLKDVNVRKGDMVQINYLYSFHDPEYFQDPDTFDPKRWLDKAKAPSHAYAFVPFSAGPRNCLGQHLAMNEARIILGELLSMYEISLPKDYKLEMTFRFMYEPLNPVMVNLVPK